MSVKGLPQLHARMQAIKPSPAMLKTLALSAIREQKIMAPVATGNLRRSIGLGSVTAQVAETIATANYASYVELGTHAHDIVPKSRKALRFAVGGNRRLSGAPRSGAPVVFAKRVHHPGTRKQPFMLPGAQKAIRAGGFRDTIVKLWNSAA